MDEPNRKLAAILSCDVVGYSRLMQADEAATVDSLKKYRAAIGRVVARHKGRVVNAPGDSILAEFPSAVEAVQAAVEIQKSVEGRNVEVAPDRRMQFRVGVNVGDVIEEDDGTIYGDGVNIAARMEALADAGGICISSAVYDAVEGKLDFGFDFLGAQQVKNIAKPVNVYRVRAEPRPAQAGHAKSGVDSRKALIGVAAAAVVVALAGVGVWQYRAAAPPDGDAPPALALPDKPSIAVLPFANLSDDPEQEYFADGLTEDLITDLSKIPDLFVIARNSSFTYKDKPTKVQQVAADLGVQYVLEGSVRRTGDAVRINAQLIDALSGHHLWAERYEGAVAGIFDFHDQVLGQIVANLAVELAGTAPFGAASPAETEVVAAYDAFLTGRDFYRRRTPQDYDRAIAAFEKAIELDPGYGRAYAALAGVYWDLTTLIWQLAIGTDFQHAYEQMLANLAKAKESPTADAYAVSAEMLARHGQHAEALADAERGIALEPNNPDIHISKARVLNVMGRADEAEQSARLALRLDPHHQPDYLRVLSLALFHQERYDEAVRVMERVVARQPDVGDDYATLASAYGHLGRMKEARSAVENFNEFSENTTGRPLTVQERGTFWWYGDIYNYDPAYLARLQEGLRKAGVPEGPGEPGRHNEYRALMSKSNGEYSVAGSTKIDAAEAKALHDRAVTFVDVRGSLNFRRGHIPGAEDLGATTVLSEQTLSERIGQNDEVVFYCFGKYCPLRAYACAKALTWGYNRVYDFAGGFPAWEDAGYPVEQAPDI
ncbi:MAG TPA: tetratricopeptide repeat protein [Alphaproteobacteria bacterium]